MDTRNFVFDAKAKGRCLKESLRLNSRAAHKKKEPGRQHLLLHELAISAGQQPINSPRGEKTVAEIRAVGGKADLTSSDLRDSSSAREVARRAVELGNHVDFLINNAGIFPFGPTNEMTEEVFDSVYSFNVKAPWVDTLKIEGRKV